MANETRAENAELPEQAEGATDSAPASDFDPARTQVPVICKDCDKEFAVPYRHFQAGVVFHCPHCHGSFVPRSANYHAVRNTVEAFFEKHRTEAAKSGDQAAAHQRQAAQLEELHRTLLELARAIHPAGKLIRRKGIGAMFT
jgi:uncharacterized Zn finger protein (UPF0148 family)